MEKRGEEGRGRWVVVSPRWPPEDEAKTGMSGCPSKAQGPVSALGNGFS